MSRSPHYIKLMNSRRWRALRMATIKRAKGLCEQCSAEGRVSAATEVHHIRPVESIKDPFVMEQLAYDPANSRLSATTATGRSIWKCTRARRRSTGDAPRRMSTVSTG